MGIRTVKTLSTLIFSAVCTFMNPLFAGDLPSFENNGHHLSCYDLKTSSNTSFEKNKITHSLSFRGYYHVPLESSKDIIAADVTRVESTVLNRDGENMVLKYSSLKKGELLYSPIHDIGKGGETANKPIDLRYELSDEAINIDRIICTVNVLEVQKRELVDWEAAVSEEYSEAVDGLLVRISGLSLKANREFKIDISYKRSASGLDAPFIEGAQVLNINNEVLGGGRWTWGNPLQLNGKFTAKFRLVSPELHHKIRLIIVSETQEIPLEFTITDIFDQ